MLSNIAPSSELKPQLCLELFVDLKTYIEKID